MVKPLSISPEYKKRPKIAPLSVLPVFFNLQGARALLVGGSDGAAWKAELLLAAGAKLKLIAQNVDVTMQALIDDPSHDITFYEREWREGDFKDARLALADFERPEFCKEFAKAARRAGVPVNIIDKPELCDFQFGSIVNRSPVVVSISTTGAAPILAQEIRRKIEILIPPSVAAWAIKAESLRASFATAVPDIQTRKAIWRNFAKAALRQPANQVDKFFSSALKLNKVPKRGKVTLVGAGPGEADLLTIKAVRALQSADVILFDSLVSDDVLELARREARRMLVGKRGGRSSCRQDDINEMMIKLARQGKHVVRLKSGDPMIFGRAGEEIETLEVEGIDVEIVPGVTAALAAASQLGVSLTHRDHAQSVKFITAHSRKGELPDLDWKSCVDEKTTLMVYMGAKTAPKLAAALMDYAMAPDMPVLIAKGVSRSKSDVSYHSLTDLLTLSIDREQPVLLGIGHVFAKRKSQSQLNEMMNGQPGDLAILAG